MESALQVSPPSASSAPSASTPSTSSAQSPLTANAPQPPTLQPPFHHQAQTSQPHPSSYPVTSPTSTTAPSASSIPPSGPSDSVATSSQSPTPRLRSSIACARCRRSKIKCSNSGAGTTCEACHHSGRECVYPVPGTSGGTIVGTGPVKREGDGDDLVTERFKRPRVRKTESDKAGGSGSTADAHGRDRKEDSTSGKWSSKGLPPPSSSAKESLAGEGLLDPVVLTPRVWSEVFELFQRHFGTDLPFLHAPTFLPPLQTAAGNPGNPFASDRSHFRDDSADMMPSCEMLLLGILTLTARFHSGLVGTHCAGAGEGGKDKPPVYASELYATALRSLLVGEKGAYIGQPNLSKIQALLMLALHEWGLCKGIKAWVHASLAIRMAQSMGLQYEDDMDSEPWALSSAMSVETQYLGFCGRKPSKEPKDPLSSDTFTDEEMRRRTFWSCFIMERYLSNGKFRPSMLTLEDMKLQLPCGERAWVFGDRVCTGLITGACSGTGASARRRAKLYRRWKDGRPDRPTDMARDDEMEDDTEVPCEWGSEEGLLSRFVRIVEIWGRVAKWSCAGGRRAEEHSPWNHQSRFYQLRDALAKFHESTPRPFRLTRPNIQAHLTQPTSSTFTLLHTIYSLCLIVLHRENIPFVPIRCSSPEGPLDEHTLPPQPPMPHNFWGDSARQLFKASRDMMDLVQACQSRGLLAETPIMGFGLYNAALIGVYAMNFPHMDLQGSMSGRGGDPNDATNGQKAARDALEIIGQMRSRLPMATNWFRTIHRLHRYYEKIINDYPDNSRSFGDSPPINGQIQHRPLALREGGPGGAAEGSKLLDKILKEFGNTEDEDVEARYVGDRRRNMSGSSNTLEPPRPPVEPRPADSWTAINSIVNPEDRPSIQHNHSSSAPHRYQDDSQSLRPAQSPSTSYPPYPRSPSSMSPMYANDQRMPYPHSPGTQQPPYHHSPPQPQQKTQSPMQYQSHYSHFPPPSRLSNLLNAPMSNHSPQSQAHPPWLSSLYKALGGHDVAAFVDGRSCEELITVATEKAARSTEKGLGDGNLTVDGWLWEVWGGSNRGGRSAAAA